MKIAIAADANMPIVKEVIAWLENHQYQVMSLKADEEKSALWPEAAKWVAEHVQSGQADSGVLLCWTGTGVDMAANKFRGIRASLCTDAETARGAKTWNNANVLCMSMRLTSTQIASEILTAWFETEYEPSEEKEICIQMLND